MARSTVDLSPRLTDVTQHPVRLLLDTILKQLIYLKMGYFFTPTAWSDFFQRFSAWFVLEPPLKDKYGFVHISTGFSAKVMVIFGSCLVLHAVVVRIVFTNLRTMSEPRKTSGFVDLSSWPGTKASLQSHQAYSGLVHFVLLFEMPQIFSLPSRMSFWWGDILRENVKKGTELGKKVCSSALMDVEFPFFSCCFFWTRPLC